MNRHIKRFHTSVVDRIIKRSPHLTPEQVAQAAERIVKHGQLNRRSF